MLSCTTCIFERKFLRFKPFLRISYLSTVFITFQPFHPPKVSSSPMIFTVLKFMTTSLIIIIIYVHVYMSILPTKSIIVVHNYMCLGIATGIRELASGGD